MTISRQEEIIAVLWAIAALLAFGFEFAVFGWVFACKAALDTLCALWFSVKEIKAEDMEGNQS